MSAPPNAAGGLPAVPAAPSSPPTYPRLGGALLGLGIGLASFIGAADGSIPHPIEGILSGIAAAASSMGLFFLGHAVGVAS